MIKTGSFLKYNEEIKQQVISLCQQGVPRSQIVEITHVKPSAIDKWTKGMRSKVCHPRYKTKFIHHDYFSPTNIGRYPERLVLVGFLAADGCIYEAKVGQKRLCLNLGKKDRAILEIFNAELCEGSRKISENAKTQSVQWYLPSDIMCDDLSLYGIVPRKTKTFNLPSLAPIEMRYFLRGYFYGDGCLHKTRNRWICHLVGNDLFVQSLIRYLTANGIVQHACVSALRKCPGFTQVAFQGKHAIAFSQFIFSDQKMMLLPRKHLPQS